MKPSPQPSVLTTRRIGRGRSIISPAAVNTEVLAAPLVTVTKRSSARYAGSWSDFRHVLGSAYHSSLFRKHPRSLRENIGSTPASSPDAIQNPRAA